MFNTDEITLMYGCPITPFHPIPKAEERISVQEETSKFDLEKALAGDPIQTKDGRHARILCDNLLVEGDEMLAVAILDEEHKTEQVYIYKKDGTIETYGLGDGLFLETGQKKTKKIQWFCLYYHYAKLGSPVHTIQHEGPFDTKEEAELFNIKSINFVKKSVYPVEIEE